MLGRIWNTPTNYEAFLEFSEFQLATRKAVFDTYYKTYCVKVAI